MTAVALAGAAYLPIDADLPAARAHAYEAVAAIHFEGAQFRRDIAVKGLPAVSA